MANEYEVIWPQSRSIGSAIKGVRTLDSLGGKRIAFIWDDMFRGADMFQAFEREAAARGQSFTTIPWQTFGDIHGHANEHEVIEQLPRLLAEHTVDAAVVGVGACGSCTPAVMRAIGAVEAAGVPALALVASGFMRQARAIGRSLGVDHVWIAEYPGVIPSDSDEVFEQKMRDAVVPSLFAGFERLAQGVDTATGSESVEPGPSDIIARGTIEELHDIFEANLWSDGLPFIPPTIEAVREFLRFTDRDPDEVLGLILPSRREATIWSVAVNGIMAGCRPEHLPILIGIVEILCDPVWRLEDAGCTPGWEPLVTVSGPLVQGLGFNAGAGLMRVGNRANTSIGRFTRLYMRNVAGLLTEPGETDKAAIGRTFNVAIAESDAGTPTVWSPERVDAGFAVEDTVVSVQSCVTISGPAYTGGTPQEQLDVLVRFAEETIGGWGFTHILYHASATLLMMSPSVAASFADAGYSKHDIQQYLADHVRQDAGYLERFGTMTRGEHLSFKEHVDAGRIPEHFAESDDPNRMIPLISDAHEVRIVVAGDPGRNQNRFYVNNHAQALPLYRKVEVNRALADRLAERSDVTATA